MNWLVPLTFAGGYYLLGTTKASPGKIVAVQINDYMDILYKAGIALLAAAVIAWGASDTAGACIATRAEVLYEQARKGREYLLGSHSKTVKNAIDGKNGAAFYEIPLDTTKTPHEQVENALRPLGSNFRLSRRNHLEEREGSFVFQYTYAPGGLKGRLARRAHITAVQKPDDQSFRLYAPFDLGVTLAKYRKEPKK